jgi:hypothetical protein
MSSTVTTRHEILDGVKTALMAAFNTTNGTVRKLIRSAYRGPVRPVVSGHPVLAVSDNGQRAGDADGKTTASAERLLAIRVTLHLGEDWSRVKAAADWTQYVEEIIKVLDGNLAVGAGLIEMNYVEDDPVDIAWGGGRTEAAWVIDFDCIRFVDY